MTDEKKPNLSTITEDEETTAGDAVFDLISGSTFPDPIKRNVFKALDRLCSALIDIPVGALGRASAEKRAEAEGRIKIREEITAQIVQQMKVDPEYARRAVNRYGEKILREQGNLDKIFAIGANLLKKDKSATSGNQDSDNEEKKTIEDDWLNSFEKEASQKSTEDMQLLFGRILAGEIGKPGLYSIKTVKILGALDQETATLFKLLCSLSVVLGHLPSKYIRDGRVCFLDEKQGKETLSKYGLDTTQLYILEEYGLIRSSFYDSSFPYDLCIVKGEDKAPIPFRHQGKDWVLVPLTKQAKHQNLNLWGITFTKASCELFNVVDQDPMTLYTEEFKRFLDGKHLQMVNVSSQNKS